MFRFNLLPPSFITYKRISKISKKNNNNQKLFSLSQKHLIKQITIMFYVFLKTTFNMLKKRRIWISLRNRTQDVMTHWTHGKQIWHYLIEKWNCRRKKIKNIHKKRIIYKSNARKIKFKTSFILDFLKLKLVFGRKLNFLWLLSSSVDHVRILQVAPSINC